MHTYHYYARARLSSGKYLELDGIINTSQPIRDNNDYNKLKDHLAAESKADIQRVAIISLSHIGVYENETG